MRARLARKLSATLALFAMMGCHSARGASASTAQRLGGARTTTPVAALTESEVRDRDIAFFTQRAEHDPTGAMDLARLGALYLERGRATGDPRAALHAEHVARRSLGNRANRNVGALQVLQSSLLSQHRFTEALPLARAVSDGDPGNAALRAAVGEIEMELGNYDSARVAFAHLAYTPGDPSVAPRLARWAELQGNVAGARRLLHESLVAVLRNVSSPNEQKAWFWLRVGDVELRSGHFHAADSAYLSGLKAHQDDYRLLSALARSALLQHNYQRAAFMGEKAIVVTLDPATLGTLSDAWGALGDSARSEEYAGALDVAVKGQPGAYHRAWSLFLLDHDRHVDVVTRKIREEIRTRRDIYAYDLLAWALHKQGRNADASVAMRRALALGTRDALLLRHAAAIERALGHEGAYRQFANEALALDPYFGVTGS